MIQIRVIERFFDFNRPRYQTGCHTVHRFAGNMKIEAVRSNMSAPCFKTNPEPTPHSSSGATAKSMMIDETDFFEDKPPWTCPVSTDTFRLLGFAGFGDLKPG